MLVSFRLQTVSVVTESALQLAEMTLVAKFARADDLLTQATFLVTFQKLGPPGVFSRFHLRDVPSISQCLTEGKGQGY